MELILGPNCSILYVCILLISTFLWRKSYSFRYICCKNHILSRHVVGKRRRKLYINFVNWIRDHVCGIKKKRSGNNILHLFNFMHSFFMKCTCYFASLSVNIQYHFVPSVLCIKRLTSWGSHHACAVVKHPAYYTVLGWAWLSRMHILQLAIQYLAFLNRIYENISCYITLNIFYWFCFAGSFVWLVLTLMSSLQLAQ